MSNQFRSHPVPAGGVHTPRNTTGSSFGPAAAGNNNTSGASQLAESGFASNSHVQQLVPSANAPLDEQVHVMRGALVVTMEEVERVRNAMLVETGKLHGEMRSVIRSVGARDGGGGYGASSAWGSSGGGPKSTDALLNASSGSQQQQQQQGGLAAAHAAAIPSEDVQNRIDYLEQAVRNIQQHQSLHAPVAMENAISQCSIFLRKADQEVQRVVAQMQEKMNTWQRIMDGFVANNGGGASASPASVQGGAQAIAAGMASAQLNNLDVMADIKRMVQGRIMELSAYIDQELAAHRSSIITLEDKMGSVVETVSSMETDNNAFRAAVSRPHVRSSLAVGASTAAAKMTPGGAAVPLDRSMNAGGPNQGVPGTGMQSPSIDDLASPPRQQGGGGGAMGMNTSGVPSMPSAGSSPIPGQQQQHVAGNALRGATVNASGRGVGSTAEAIQSLLREFTQVESQVLKEEILKQLDGESSLTRRRLEERQRGEQVSMLRSDVVRTVTALETVQEDHTRMERSQQDMHRAFQRLEQQFNLLQHKTEGDIRTELSRLESTQKSFFTRQEQLIAAERQQMITTVTEQVNRMQQKHVEEVRMAERRRMDDLQSAQKQIRDDFVSFAEKQRKDLDEAVSHVKEDFTAMSNTAADNVARALANATDATRRSFMNTTDEMRKGANKMGDDMRRLQSTVDDSVKRSQEQSSFLQSRLQQVIDEQIVRVDRMGDDLALRLNTAVEEEVKRMTTSSETAMQRAFATVDDRQSRDAKTLREEVSAVRQALHAMSAPSSTLQSMDSRVDALRNDVQEMFETVAALKRNEPRVAADTRREVNSALETARSEITRNVGQQLQQFDSTLAELHRESMLRSQELTALQMRLDQAVQQGAVQGTGGGFGTPTTGAVSGAGGFGFAGRGLTVSQTPVQPQPQPQHVVTTAAGGGGAGRTGSQTGNLPGGAGNVMPPATPTAATPGGSVAPKRDALQGAFDP